MEKSRKEIRAEYERSKKRWFIGTCLGLATVVTLITIYDLWPHAIAAMIAVWLATFVAR